MNINPSLSVNPVFTAEASSPASINDLFAKAQTTTAVPEKRVHFNAIYQILRAQPSVEPQQLSRLFEEYASQTCYARTDLENGYIRSARLMELNFQMLLGAMNLGSYSFDWKKYPNIEDLIAYLEREKNDFDAINGLILDENVLVQQAIDLRETLAKTLLRLSFSYQNIANTNADPYIAIYQKLKKEEATGNDIASLHNLFEIEKNKAKNLLTFHQKLDTWAEKIIGEETQEQKEMLVDYRYNRCCFLAILTNPDDFDSHFNSYVNVEKFGKEIYSSDSPKFLSLLAKIDNMRGLTILKSPAFNVDYQTRLLMANEFFTLSFNIRRDLLTREPENIENFFLFANVQTGMVHCLLNIQPVTQESVCKAQQHTAMLELYLRTNPNHEYAKSWKSSILNVEDAAGKFSIQIKAPLKL